MNKYFRVPNGIIDRTTYGSDTFVLDYAIKHNFPSSNDLAELCDEFVFEGVDEAPLLCTYEELIYWFNYSKEQQYKTKNCYGAIWTGDGLRYVAKMNKDRELELI